MLILFLSFFLGEQAKMLRLGQKSLSRLMSSEATSTRASNLVDSIVRVDHAGELGADRIYAGQMAILGKSKDNSNSKLFKFIVKGLNNV